MQSALGNPVNRNHDKVECRLSFKREVILKRVFANRIVLDALVKRIDIFENDVDEPAVAISLLHRATPRRS